MMEQISVSSFFRERPIPMITTILLIGFFATNYLLSEPVQILGLVPVNTFIANKYVWNLLTSQFFENNVAKLALDLALLWITIKPIKIANSEQFGFYLTVCILSSSFGTSAFYFLRFFASRMEDMLIHPTFGFSGLYMALLMFLRQQNPKETSPVVDSVPFITYHNLPVLVILAQLILGFFSLTIYATDLPFTVIVFFVSWTYLRFFYRYEENSPLGDNSEDFLFVAMFPEPLKPVTVPMSIAFYNIFAMIGLFPELEQVEKRPTHHLRYKQLSK